MIRFFTTNIPLFPWAEIFQDKNLTNTLIDQLVYHAKITKINGKSYQIKDYKEKNCRIGNLVICGLKTYIFE
ncbi:ATP-binding protein [Enterococcus hirae]|uniref:ATP-binding protein n=1 Tax=Enterococcus hirae TaxID=1354 RepID=UPI003FD4B9E7